MTLINKRGQGFELGEKRTNPEEQSRAGLDPWTAGLRVRRADYSATLPPLFVIFLLNPWTTTACGQAVRVHDK